MKVISVTKLIIVTMVLSNVLFAYSCKQARKAVNPSSVEVNDEGNKVIECSYCGKEISAETTPNVWMHSNGGKGVECYNINTTSSFNREKVYCSKKCCRLDNK